MPNEQFCTSSLSKTFFFSDIYIFVFFQSVFFGNHKPKVKFYLHLSATHKNIEVALKWHWHIRNSNAWLFCVKFWFSHFSDKLKLRHVKNFYNIQPIWVIIIVNNKGRQVYRQSECEIKSGIRRESLFFFKRKRFWNFHTFVCQRLGDVCKGPVIFFLEFGVEKQSII